MSSTYFALPSLALAAVLVIAPGASATAGPTGRSTVPTSASSTCGLAAVPATYETVHHPAETRIVPARTHEEWRWQREVPTTEVQIARVVVAAARSSVWSRVVEHREAQYTRTVIDQPHVPGSPEEGHFVTDVVAPAVTVLEWEYRQHQTGIVRWRDHPTWNPGEGWGLTGETRTRELVPAVTNEVWVVTKPAVPEVPERSHVDIVWVPTGETGPAGFTPTGETRLVGSDVEKVSLAEGVVPEGTGWIQGEVLESPAVTEERWIAEGDPTPDGFASTGATRAGVPTLQTAPSSPTPPAGDDWEVVPGSEVVVTDSEETVEIITPARDEQVLVAPGIPGTAPCAGDPAEGAPAEGSPAEETPVEEIPADVDPADVDPAEEIPAQEPGESIEDVDSEAAPTGRTPADDAERGTLPATGAGVSPWLLALGGGSLLSGLALALGRRRAD